MMEIRFGDIAKHSALRRAGTGLKQQITVLSGELTTGQVSDKARHLSGDLTRLASLNRSIEQARIHQQSAQSLGLILEVQQSVIADIGELAQQRFLDLTLLQQAGPLSGVSVAIDMMMQGFSEIVEKLNTNVARRTVFAGVASDGPALISAEQMLDSLIAGLPPGATPDDVADFVVQWFAPGNDFDSSAYLGGVSIPSRIDLGQGISAGVSETAQADAFRTTLAAFATAAIMSRGLFATVPEAQQDLLDRASEGLMQSGAGLTALAAQIGVEEATVARAAGRAAAEENAMSLAAAVLVEADPYDTAARLESTIAQLESVYVLTARLSRLSLLEYLR